MNVKEYIEQMALQAKDASRIVAGLSTSKKNNCLERVAKILEHETQSIITANQKDLENARQMKLSPAMMDRLELNEKRIQSMAEGVRTIASLDDPVGIIEKAWERPNGLRIKKVRCPIGVIGIIYESRPNVTVDAAALCFKAGSAVILKGGKESFETNMHLKNLMSQALESEDVPRAAIQIVETTDREAVQHMLRQNQSIDLIIPRGGEALIRAVSENSLIPVIKHYKGVCHVYVDCEAGLDMAKDIVINAKVQRPGVCNAMETLLIHESLADTFLPQIVHALRDKNVLVKGCSKTCEKIKDAEKATEDDWYEEYLDLILSVKLVRDTKEAVDHINHYGSGHSDAIVTENVQNAAYFLREVDSSSVYHNCSTRFTDGYEFGFGAEMGISTDKIHARGPMGLPELTTYKYVVEGNGQIRQ